MLVSFPDAPPTRGKERLVTIDAKLGPNDVIYPAVVECAIIISWARAFLIRAVSWLNIIYSYQWLTLGLALPMPVISHRASGPILRNLDQGC